MIRNKKFKREKNSGSKENNKERMTTTTDINPEELTIEIRMTPKRKSNQLMTIILKNYYKKTCKN